MNLDVGSGGSELFRCTWGVFWSPCGPGLGEQRGAGSRDEGAVFTSQLLSSLLSRLLSQQKVGPGFSSHTSACGEIAVSHGFIVVFPSIHGPLPRLLETV